MPCYLAPQLVQFRNMSKQHNKEEHMDQPVIGDSVHQAYQYGSLALPRGQLQMPVFMPDATLAAVHAVDATDLRACRIQALVMNTFHLMQHPGSSTIQALGGLHKMSAWPRPIVTDSGGFQAYSLIQQNPKFGSIDDDGI